MNRSLERFECILDCFSRQRPSLTFSEIVESTDLEKSTAQRLLEARSWLRRDPANRAHALGFKLIEWGSTAIDSIDARRGDRGGP